MSVDPGFWKGRRVLVTGHTGFKGSWLTLWLRAMDAEVVGVSDAVPTSPSLFEAGGVADGIADLRADVRDAEAIDRAFAEHEPEVVIHMAAQSLVRRSYRDPRTTYAHERHGHGQRARGGALDAVRRRDRERHERQELRQPRSTAARSWRPIPWAATIPTRARRARRRSSRRPTCGPTTSPLASARAGNVIGGGDFSEDRLLADIARHAMGGAPAPIRSPQAVRPWQHVLNPLSGYLELAQRLAAGEDVRGAWNFGPEPGDVQTVAWLVERLTELWPTTLRWEIDPGPHPHEAGHLALDSTRRARSSAGAPAGTSPRRWRRSSSGTPSSSTIARSGRSRSTRSSASLPSAR